MRNEMKHYINGEWVESTGSETIDVINPATEEVIDRVCCDDRRKVHEKFRRLRRGQQEWEQCGFDVRSRKVARLRDVIDSRSAQFSQLLVREVGTPVGQAYDEVRVAQQRIEEFLQGGAQAVESSVMEKGSTGRRTEVCRVPFGVTAHLSSWNRPLVTAVEIMVPALLAGNSVLYKPSEHAALMGRAVVEAMREAEIAEAIVALVQGDGSVGDFVLDEPLSVVAFSGSPTTAQMVAEKLARRMIPRHIDAGVTEGVYVCEDVDVEYAAFKVAERAFCSGGRGHRGVDRIYVHEAVARPFTDALCRRVSSFDVGDPARKSTFVGPLVCARRVGQLEFQIGDAVRKGARLLLGGRANGGRGYFFDPTVLVDVDHRMLVMREETPGPVLCVQRVCDDAEAGHRLGDVDHSLWAGMICADRERAEEVFRTLDADRVYWWSGVASEEGSRPQVSGNGLAPAMSELPVDAVRRFTRPQSRFL